MQVYAHGRMEVDLCGRCGGLWLDRGEAKALVRSERLPRWLVRPLFAVDDPAPTPEGQRGCPRCWTLLNVGAVQGVSLEACPDCHGVFMDRGEFESLRTRTGKRDVAARP